MLGLVRRWVAGGGGRRAVLETSLQPPSKRRPLQERPLDLQRSRIHQLAGLAVGPSPLRHRVVVGIDHLLRQLGLHGRRREDVVAGRSLDRVDAPTSDGAEGAGVGGLPDVGLVVPEVAKGPLMASGVGGAGCDDRADTGTAGDQMSFERQRD